MICNRCGQKIFNAQPESNQSQKPIPVKCPHCGFVNE
jgi:DNA-directed RNA polymerase subunit RPC12/RpoP